MKFVNLDYDSSAVEGITFNGKPVPPDKVRYADEKTGQLTFYVCDSQGRFTFDVSTRDAKVHTVTGEVKIQWKIK